MSLGAIGTAFVLVAVVFNAAALISARWATGGSGLGVGGSGNGGGRGSRSWGRLARAVWPAATAEALVLTLLAALWFGSLGSGGWLLVFLLLGTLVASGDRWLRHRLLASPIGDELRLFGAGVLKYLLAGLVCAWRLS